MKLPVLQGLDLSQADKILSVDSPVRSISRNVSRIRSQKDVEVLADEVLDGDLVSTPPFGSRTSARLRLSTLSMNKRQSSEAEANSEVANGEDVEMLSERRRSLFEPLSSNGPKSPDSLLPPPDFDVATYPRGWVIGKKRKLVNVDVVESMRRIAIHEMNRKDREIDGLSEQLEEDSRTMEHLQLELQQERRKRLQVEREKSSLQEQVNMLMTMLNELEEDPEAEQMDDSQVINS
ncbi:hypothetical protein GOP47_0014242 [Adiantum capillus-veneris]|uniref:Protein HEADING DATE REPRESSOR 1 n=1 Tax=Adiantum capillus-veneris TaxID=13818 RepID=A0A9D4ULP3_ADICA|nr:hypothetical protein GOP47_0014242 [Adiantum capillus-veneris]